jgi:hypothetical protein
MMQDRDWEYRLSLHQQAFGAAPSGAASAFLGHWTDSGLPVKLRVSHPKPDTGTSARPSDESPRCEVGQAISPRKGVPVHPY